MKDQSNTGGTHYEDATGKEISEQEYLDLTNKNTTAGDSSESSEKSGGTQAENKGGKKR